MLSNVQYHKVDEQGHLHIQVGDHPQVLEVDNIVICAGQVFSVSCKLEKVEYIACCLQF